MIRSPMEHDASVAWVTSLAERMAEAAIGTI
jgi:hypothetical protein